MARAGRGTRDVLDRLREVVLSEGGPLATGLITIRARQVFGPLASRCLSSTEERGGGDGRGGGDERAAEYSLLVESIFEGYLLHYAGSRLLELDDRDLRLLAGDFMYAYGLTRLARLGDLSAVEDLADLITLCAQVHTTLEPDQDGTLDVVSGLWALTALAVGGGRWPAYEQAKSLARRGLRDGATEVREAATARAAQLGLGIDLERALIAFRQTVTGAGPST